jgi:hypothetical protein
LAARHGRQCTTAGWNRQSGCGEDPAAGAG